MHQLKVIYFNAVSCDWFAVLLRIHNSNKPFFIHTFSLYHKDKKCLLSESPKGISIGGGVCVCVQRQKASSHNYGICGIWAYAVLMLAT